MNKKLNVTLLVIIALASCIKVISLLQSFLPGSIFKDCAGYLLSGHVDYFCSSPVTNNISDNLKVLFIFDSKWTISTYNCTGKKATIISPLNKVNGYYTWSVKKYDYSYECKEYIILRQINFYLYIIFFITAVSLHNKLKRFYLNIRIRLC